MTTTDNFIISQVWELANMDPNKTGGKTGSQTRAFRLLLVTHGGIEFIACRPATELEELGRRGVCSSNLHMILRQLAGVELRARGLRQDLAGLRLEWERLTSDAASPENLKTNPRPPTRSVPKTQRERHL